jgi:hypothetical protein
MSLNFARGDIVDCTTVTEITCRFVGHLASPPLAQSGVAQRYTGIERLIQTVTKSPCGRFCNQRIGDGAVFAENAGGAHLIQAHQSRVTGHVSRHYGG